MTKKQQPGSRFKINSRSPEVKEDIFNQYVESCFEFLIDDYDFEIVERSAFGRLYGSKNIKAKISYSSFRGNLDFEIANKLVEEGRFTNLYYIWACKDLKEYRYLNPTMSVNEAKDIPKCLEKLSSLVREICGDLLLGGIQEFETLAECREAHIHEYHLQNSFLWERKKANLAWREKNFNEVVKYLSLLSENLTVSEERRLRFAKKKIQGNN